MANDKKFIVKKGLATPNVDFANGGGSISATFLSTSNTLSFSGNTGQLFSITDSMSGTIFSVNDISGIPSIEVIDTGDVKLAETFGSVAIGANTVSNYKFYVNGNTLFGNSVTLNSTVIANGTVGTSGFVLTSNGTGVYWAAANSSIASVATANNATFAYGKQESQLSVANAVFATTANNALRFNGKQESQLSVAISVTANNATYAYGKQESQLSVASATSATTAGSVTNAVTFNNGGAGAASGTTFNGSAARTISYNTLGAPSTTGTNASGTWGISITGNAANATFATTANNALHLNGKQESQLSVANAVFAQSAGSVIGGVSTANNASYLDGRTWATPFAIGATVANTGAFTTLTASANVNLDSGALFVDSLSNRVGVNTVTPLHAHHVAGSLYSTGDASAVSLYMNSSQAIRSSGTIYIDADTSGQNGFTRVGTGDIIFRTAAATERMRIISNGRIGIGNTTPGQTLQVDGSVGIKNALVANGSIGANGTVLTSNGSTIYWAAANSIIASVATANNANFLQERTWATPFAIGSTVANTGAFTTLTTSNNVGIGTTTPDSKLGAYKGLAIDGGTNGAVQIGGTSFSSVLFGDASDSDVGTIAYSHSSNYMAFFTNTSERMRIDNAGNIGIGTAPSGTFRLNVNSASSDSLRLYSVGSTTTLTIANDTNVNQIRSTSGRLGLFHNVGGTLTEGLSLTAAGNVGIGLTSPAAQLQVASATSSPDRGLTVSQHITSAPAALMNFRKSRGTVTSPTTVVNNDYTGVFQFLNYDGGAYRINAGFGARVTGTVTTNSVPTDLFFYTSATDELDPYANGKVRMLINSAGNVGIGTTTPSYKLEVNGSFAATTKSFVIDHPTKPDMKLRYGSLEGPENGVYVRGRLRYSNTIKLPDYWTGLVDENTITVNLTPIGSHQNLYIENIIDNTVIVGNDNLLNKEINCFYTIFAERKDVDKLEVEIKGL